MHSLVLNGYALVYTAWTVMNSYVLFYIESTAMHSLVVNCNALFWTDWTVMQSLVLNCPIYWSNWTLASAHLPMWGDQLSYHLHIWKNRCCLEPHNTELYCSAVNYTAMQCSELYCSAVNYTAVQCSELYCSALQCTAVHCTVLHDTTALLLLARNLPW